MSLYIIWYHYALKLVSTTFGLKMSIGHSLSDNYIVPVFHVLSDVIATTNGIMFIKITVERK